MRQRTRAGRRTGRPGFFLAAAAAVAALLPMATPASAGDAPPPPFAPPLHAAPLRGALILNGGYGDYRGGHFHAGFDLGTGHRVGRAVHAPASGWIERVRSSGVGYGRALYLRTRDGRTLEFGHLDAFAGPIADFVGRAMDSTAAYEQDLWPARGAFAVRAGDVVAWSGESGAGGPHLHFEIRRGDVAYNPMRAGLSGPDRVPPTLVGLTLEPLDDSSMVAGRSAPVAVSLARPDTVRAIGRLRAVVRATDQMSLGGERTVPWRVGVEWNGRRTECRFDSVSWATDMPEADYVYDAGRVVGERGLVLWAPAGFRPRVVVADAPISEEAGTIEIAPGDRPRALVVSARDLAGHVVTRRVVIRPGPPAPPAIPAWWHGDTPWSGASATFASLPDGFLRVGLREGSAPRELDLQVGGVGRHATKNGDAWSATFSVPSEASGRTVRLPIAAQASGGTGPATVRGGFVWARHALPADTLELADETGEFRVRFPAKSLFEDAVVLCYPAASEAAPAPDGLAPIGRAWRVEPSALPLRRAARVALLAPPDAPGDRVGLYRLDSGSWQWVGARRDSVTRAVSAESRRLGCFALFRDLAPPSAKLLPPGPLPAKHGPYSRWAVEATARDVGSGIDPAASYFEIDGRRVPTEWDPEAGRLRWRPRKPPAKGTHEVRITVADREGNTVRTTGTFEVGP